MGKDCAQNVCLLRFDRKQDVPNNKKEYSLSSQFVWGKFHPVDRSLEELLHSTDKQKTCAHHASSSFTAQTWDLKCRETGKFGDNWVR